jgi:ABC-type lipoprotein export system ATPase subunit
MRAPADRGLEIVQGVKRYGDRAVLDGLNLRVSPGDRLVILGPSGAGKSTLLSVLGGMEGLDGGSFLVDGRDHSGFTRREAEAYRNRRIGFVFQRHCLLPQFDLLENIMVPVLDTGPARRDKLAKTREWLVRAGLESRAGALPAEVSVGEGQRAAVLRALINDPDFLLADEPTGSLDQATGCAVLDFLLERQAERGLALVIVTHDREIAGRASAGGGRVITLRDGVLHDAP